ncbi:multicopper oxidase family protein [Allocoleopsis sp.]|uniref:multicopper oxidase family protein n=1 Tax=Allocoleopsis sp. TaxID=3088169 RepID=UPI002FD3E3A4
MNITRREALKLGLAGGGVLLSPLGFASKAWAATERCKEPLPLNTQLPKLSPPLLERRFEAELPIPTALPPVLSKTYKVTRRGITYEQPIDYYQITMGKQRVEILPAKDGKPAIKAEFWTYNGMVPGPLIRQVKNRESCIRFINQLGKDDTGNEICTSVHLHGMASLPQYDGYAEDLTLDGYYKDYYYPNNRASILWYHDHTVHKTSRNVYMGLAGMYIVEYAKEDFCDSQQAGCLPSGEFEVPLIIQDKTFETLSQQGTSQEWKLVFNDRRQQGVYADVILVNGRFYPHMTVKRRKYFFRILNASASRTYQLTLSPKETTQVSGNPVYQLAVVGSDAGLLAEPVYLTAPQALRIGVAERYGVIIDFSKFPKDVKQVYLKNIAFPSNLGSEPSALMRFDLLDEPVTNSCEIPNPLGIMTDRKALQDRAVKTRTFRFGRSNQWTINNNAWSPSRVDADPGQCDIEIWNLVNTGGWAHPVHIHLIDFRVIDRNGQAPLPYETGWKDVVLLSPLETVRVVAKFAPHRGKYMMHCHNIVHEDHDMMTQFEVGKAGPSPLCDPAKPLPPEHPLGETNPPALIEDIPCTCFEPLPNNCNVKIEPPPDCKAAFPQ